MADEDGGLMIGTDKHLGIKHISGSGNQNPCLIFKKFMCLLRVVV